MSQQNDKVERGTEARRLAKPGLLVVLVRGAGDERAAIGGVDHVVVVCHAVDQARLAPLLARAVGCGGTGRRVLRRPRRRLLLAPCVFQRCRQRPRATAGGSGSGRCRRGRSDKASIGRWRIGPLVDIKVAAGGEVRRDAREARDALGSAVEARHVWPMPLVPVLDGDRRDARHGRRRARVVDAQVGRRRGEVDEGWVVPRCQRRLSFRACGQLEGWGVGRGGRRAWERAWCRCC